VQLESCCSTTISHVLAWSSKMSILINLKVWMLDLIMLIL